MADPFIEVDGHVREITKEEVDFYEEHGWVKLDRLVSPELAVEMRRVGEEHLIEETPGGDAARNFLAKDGIEPFRSFIFGRAMARNAQILFNRKRLACVDVGVRFRADHFVKRAGAETRGTPYHQDSTEHGSDRKGEFNLWLALDEVTPEMGAVRYLTGAHREGPLGCVLRKEGGEDLLDRYPKLTELYELSPPFSYQPGDATVHHGFMIHGAPPNRTDHPRWSYVYSYTPADTRYALGDGCERREAVDWPLVLGADG